MNRYLLLLTAGFPFGTGEPFLESEIAFHCRHFDKVIVLAQDIDSTQTEHRPMPQGVDFYNISRSSKMAGRARDCLHGALSCAHSSEAYRADRDAVGKSLKKRLFLEYFEARSRRHFREMLSCLSGISFSPDDKIVIYSYWFFAAARSGALLKQELCSRGLNAVLVSRGHGYDVYDYANALGYLPERPALLALTDKLCVCSNDGRERLSKLYPAFADKIQCSYLGTPDMGEGVACGEQFVILTCSRVVPLKRLDRLAKALKGLKDYPVKFKWVHFGDGPELSTLKSFVRSELSFMETYFPGALSNEQVLDYYKNNPVGVFVNVSSTEGLPVSIMEAMSFGTPAIATDVGGTRELVSDLSGGVLLSKDFTDCELLDAVKKTAMQPHEQMQTLRGLARSKWKESFCADKNYSNFSLMLKNMQ